MVPNVNEMYTMKDLDTVPTYRTGTMKVFGTVILDIERPKYAK